MNNQKETYLGDSVFVSFDGQMLKLRTGDGNNQVIYLEPGVLSALWNYVQLLKGKSNADIEPR